MKKLLLLTIALFSLTISNAQESRVEISPYVATGISIPNTKDLASDAYMSAEVGVMIDNFAFGGVFGVNNLRSFESINGYWYEGKVSYAFPMGFVDGYGVIGIGSYIGIPNSVFIEYGGGISKSFGDHLGAFVQVSSWDGIVYCTPGLMYSF